MALAMRRMRQDRPLTWSDGEAVLFPISFCRRRGLPLPDVEKISNIYADTALRQALQARLNRPNLDTLSLVEKAMKRYLVVFDSGAYGAVYFRPYLPSFGKLHPEYYEYRFWEAWKMFGACFQRPGKLRGDLPVPPGAVRPGILSQMPTSVKEDLKEEKKRKPAFSAPASPPPDPFPERTSFLLVLTANTQGTDLKYTVCGEGSRQAHLLQEALKGRFVLRSVGIDLDLAKSLRKVPGVALFAVGLQAPDPVPVPTEVFVPCRVLGDTGGEKLVRISGSALAVLRSEKAPPFPYNSGVVLKVLKS